MSRRKKNMMTPAAVAEQLAQYIAKQEKTLQQYRVGPLANSAKMNLAKGKKALAALQQENETMRVGQEQQQGQQMNLGGVPSAGGTDTSFGMTPSQQAMVDTLSSEYGMSPAIAAAVAAVTQKESGGSGTKTETDYSQTSNERIRGVNSRFKRKFKDMSDEDLTALKADPEKFFNYVYDDASGNSAEGDGYKYRGRGLVQVTGKDNYARVSKAVYGDDRLVKNPELLLNDKDAGAAAAYFAAESGKGVEGYVDFDLSTPDPTPEQIQQVLNGSYAVIASGGTLSKAEAQNPEKMAERYGQFNTSMPKMQQFAQQAVPTAQGVQSTGNPEQLINTPNEMLSPQGQAERAAVLGQDAAAVPEAAATPSVAQATPQTARERQGSEAAGYAYRELDFNSARSTGEPNVVSGSNITYSRNEFGDYNVIVPDKGFGKMEGGYGRGGSKGFAGKYVIKAKDFNTEAIESSLGNAIPYLDDVDGAATDGDRQSVFASVFADPTMQNMSLDMDAAMVASTIGGGQESELQSGMGMSFKDVATIVAEQQGIKPAKVNKVRVGSEMGKPMYANVADPADLERYDKQMQSVYEEISANPGTYKFKDEQGIDRVGVGGYSPYSDYVAYNTGNADFQTRYQNRQQTYGLGGQFLVPGSYGELVRKAAVQRGGAALGKGLGDDAIRALQAGDDAALNLAVANEAKLLGQGQKMLPQGSAGPAVKLAPGTKFKPGTRAAGEPVTIVPARNAAGRTIDITPVSTTQRGALTARQQIQQSGTNVLDEGAGGVLGVESGQFRFPAGSSGGQGGQFGGLQPGGLSMPGSRLPAVRNVGLQTTRQGSTALAPINPMTGLPARSAMQTQSLGLADEALATIPRTAGQNQTFGQYMRGVKDYMLTGQRGVNAANMLGAGIEGAMAADPQFDPRVFQEPKGNQTPVPPVLDSDGDGIPDTIDADGGEGTAGVGTPVNKRDETPVEKTELSGPDTYNIDMGNAAALMGVPALASLASAGVQRRALNQMQGPTAPVLNQIPNFDYRSNVGQQLIDARESSRAVGQNTNLQGTQQAALAQSLNAQRMQQETRIRQGDEAMRQQALDRYNTGTTQMRQMNNAMINQYNQDSTNFDNAMTQAQAAVSQQPLNVVSGVAQDYLKNIYQTNMANTLEGIGRQFNTGNIAGQNMGMQQGNLVPVRGADGVTIIGYQQAP